MVKWLTLAFSTRARALPSVEMVVIGTIQVAFGKMADFGERKENCVSQDWQHKKEKHSYQSFSLMVSYQKM